MIIGSLLIFAISWYWLTQQLSLLLNKQMNEVGTELTKIAAIASSESVVAKDDLFFEEFSQRLIVTGYIDKVSIYKLDGSLLAEHSNEALEAQPASSTGDSLLNYIASYLPKYKNNSVPFIQRIYWQDNAVGWIELTINRHILEQDFSQASIKATILILSLFFLVLIILSIVIFKRKNTVILLPKTPMTINSDKGSKLANIDNLTAAAKAVKQDNSDLTFRSANLKSRDKSSSQLSTEQLLIIQTVVAAAPNEQLLVWRTLIDNLCHKLVLTHAFISQDRLAIWSTDNNPDSVIKMVLIINRILQHKRMNQLTVKVKILQGSFHGELLEHCFLLLNPASNNLIDDDSQDQTFSLPEQGITYQAISKEVKEIGQNNDELESIVKRQADLLIEQFWPDN
jgi:hypothetical protein